jgi:hypothetical protein
MKSTQKGNQYEKEAKTVLERDGWHVEGQHRKVLYIKDKFTGQMKLIMAGRDIYGCDLIAKKLGLKTKWIQVSTVTQKSSKERQVLLFPWSLEFEEVELWLRVHGKREFRVFRLVSGAKFVEIDTRSLKGDKNDEESMDGDEGLEEKMASEYPE